ncbi:MAG: hypothetical protein M3345_01010 [Actinomycetota bacterium]|nr:hypothetical protein [Actinomycetota bacterium]
MKKLFWIAAVLGSLAAVNAKLEATHHCECRPDCWCKRPGLRHFRWVFPVGHSLP